MLSFNTITVEFSRGLSIIEGDRGFINISYNDAISQTFTVTVESYQCSGANAAIRKCHYCSRGPPRFQIMSMALGIKWSH